jgi:hypothetical protein
MIWQSYWKLYHWRSQHEYGTSVMVRWYILAVLCDMFSITHITIHGQMQEDPLHDLHARQN